MKGVPERYKSRRITPWDDEAALTSSQSFISTHYKEHYEQRHPKLSETGEVELINTYIPAKCPYCGSELFSKFGHTKIGVQRYLNLYTFVLNPPTDRLEKVDKLLNLVFQNPKLLRYRNRYAENRAFGSK